MLFYIARQPIFDRMSDIIAYELLYRDADKETANIKDADAATSSVLMGSTLVASLDELVGDKRAFINFTKNLINDGTTLMFSKKHITVEILEDIIPDDIFIANLLELKDKGYTLALDDFTMNYPYTEIMELVDIIKVDFIDTTKEEQKEIIKRFKRPGLKFLAEKVETLEEFKRAKAVGYDYFQGYYFSKPSVFKYKDISLLGTSHFDMINVLESPNPNYTSLVAIVEKDVSLSYKLFKYANSPMYGGIGEIRTIRSALVRLGFANVKRWMYLVVLRSMSTGQSEELVGISLQRAKMLELMAEEYGMPDRASECFLVGLFSMLDVLMNKPLESVLEDIPLADETKEAILYRKNELGRPLNLAIAYEKGDWEQVNYLCEKLGLSKQIITQGYIKAIKWSAETVKITK